MAGPGVKPHETPPNSHKIASAKEDSRIVAEETVLSHGSSLHDTDDDLPYPHSQYSNDLSSITPINDYQEGHNRNVAEEGALASELELPNESDSGLDAPFHVKTDAVTAAQSSLISSARIQVDEYFAAEAEIQKYYQNQDGLKLRAPERQNVVAAPEQHISLKPEHSIFASQTTPSAIDLSADEEDYLAVMMRKLADQYENELRFLGGHKIATRADPGEGAKKVGLVVSNHDGGITCDFNNFAEQSRDKQNPILVGLDFIGENENHSDMIKQLAAVGDGEPNKGSGSFLASRGRHTCKREDSLLRDERGHGHISSLRPRSDFGLGRRPCFDTVENVPLHAPLNDPKLANSFTLARSMKFISAEGKSSQGRLSTIHSSVKKSVSTTRATIVAAQIQIPSAKTAMRCRQTFFTKDTSAYLVDKNAAVETTFNNDWLSIASSPPVAKSTAPSSSSSNRGTNSAPCLGDPTHQIPAEGVTRGSSDGADSFAQSDYNSPLLSLQSVQDWANEHALDNIYNAPQLPPPRLISLSPARSAALEDALLDLRELQDEDNLDWMSIPVLQPALSSEAAPSNQQAAGVTTVVNSNDSILLMNFESPSRVTDQSSASPSYHRHGSTLATTMALSLMDQCSATDEKLSDCRDIGGGVRNTLAVAAVESTASRIRYGRDKLISMRHNGPSDILDSLPTIVCSCRPRPCIQSSSLSGLKQPEPLLSQIGGTTASAVKAVSEVKRTFRLGRPGDSKWASLEGSDSITPKVSLPPPQFEGLTISVDEIVPIRNKAFNIDGLSNFRWASSKKATLAAPEPYPKKNANSSAEDESVLVEIEKANKLGGLADSKYASPKKPPEKTAPDSSRDAGHPTPGRPHSPPTQSPATGVSNSENVEPGRSWALDENTPPFLSSRREHDGFSMDGGDEISSSPRRRRCSLSRSPSKSQFWSEKNFDSEFQGAAGDALAAVSPSLVPFAEKLNLHHHRAGAVHVPVEEFGRMRLGAPAVPFLPPAPTPVPEMPAAFVANSSQPLLLQGHAFITGGRGEVRRVRCGVKGSPWHDKATNTVMANIIVSHRTDRETEMVGALHGLPYDLQGNCWHADLFQAVEDLESEEEAVPIGPPRIDPDLVYSSQPDAAVYSWQSGLEKASLPRFVPGPNDNFGSPPLPIYPTVVPSSLTHPQIDLPQTCIYPVPPPAATNLVHFHPVADRSLVVGAPRDSFTDSVNNLSGATLVASAFPSANADRRYTFGISLMPNFPNHSGYQNPQVQTQDNANQQLFNHYVVQAQQPNPPERALHHYFSEFQTPQVQTQDHPNQDLFNHYIRQAQQPSAAQRSLQRIEQLLGPPVQFSPRRPNVPDACSPNLPDGPPALGTIFGNFPNSVTGRPDLAPEDAFDYQPPAPGDLARHSHFEGFDVVFRRVPRANAAIPIVDPNILSVSCPPIRGILKRSRGEDVAKERIGHDNETKTV